MLAYVAPFLTKQERDKLDINSRRRRTFNFTLVAEGWAASFPVWPSFPSRREDFDSFLAAARTAWKYRKGNWAGKNKTTLLTGYEFRALIKIGRMVLDGIKDGDERREATTTDILNAFARHCVDVNGTSHGRFGFIRVPPGDRLWAWNAKQAKALQDYMRA
jgi:hypothetical protein